MSNLQKKETPSVAEQFKVVAKQTFTKKDGTLNPVSIGLAALIVALLVGLTGTVVYRTSPKSMQEDIVNGLSSEEAQKAIQNAFLAGLDGYLNGEMTQEEAYDKIMQLMADYLNSSSAFTENQKTELMDILQQYLADINIEELITNNQEAITKLDKEFSRYQKENERVIENLKTSLETEIQTNKEYTQEQLDILNELHEKLEKLEASHYAELNNYIEETYNKLYSDQQTKMYKDVDTWQAPGTEIKDKDGNVTGTVEYKIDQYVIYGDTLYRNITGESTNTPPSQDKDNWEQVSIMKTVQDNYNTFITNLYSGMTEWNATGAYTPNSYVFYHNKIYRNKTGLNTSTTPDKDTANWEESSIMTVINNTYNSFITAVGANDWNPGSSYEAGDYVMYNGSLYRNESGNNPTPGTSSADWAPVTIVESIETLNNRVDELELKTATDLDDLKDNLLKLIEDNQSLSDEQRQKLKDLINSATDQSESGLKQLYNDLIAAMNEGDQSLAEQNTKDRDKLLAALETLNNNTAATMDSLERRVKNLEDRTTWTVGDERSEFQYRVDDGTQGYVDGAGNWHPF